MIYLSLLDVIALNYRILLDEHQGSQVLNEGLLASAITRPQMAAHYESADVLTQTALLIQGIALAHAFIDGNKRTALAAGTIFLDYNGFYVDSPPGEFASKIEALVLHTLSFEAFVEWLQERVRPNP